LQINFANEYALANLGLSLEELQKRKFLSLYPELHAEYFITLTAPLRKGEQESIKYQAVQARADGSTYPVEINLQLLTAEGKNECLAIVNDITALKQAEENIRKFNAPVERREAGR
jgi:PAS domain S-box-containing protein